MYRLSVDRIVDRPYRGRARASAKRRLSSPERNERASWDDSVAEGKVEGDIKISGPVDSLYYDVPEKLSLAGTSDVHRLPPPRHVFVSLNSSVFKRLNDR